MKLTSALILSSFLFVSLSGHAADEAATSLPAPMATPSAPEASLSTTVTAPQAKPSSVLNSVVLGYKSFNETGRFGFREQKVSKDSFNGRTYKGKHEVKLGYKHTSGWGGFGQITQVRHDFKENPSNNNKWASSDPSLTLTHPDFYNDGKLKLFGSLRYYVPNTDRSKALGVRQFAYYFDVIYKMAQDQEIFNEFNPRAFGQDSYAPTDTRVKLEDITTYTKKLGTWGRYGVGQWTQYEQHAEAPHGLTVDVFPFFDYTLSSKIFMGPRVYMPVLVQNSVYDGSRVATWENAYFQLFISASL